MNISLSKGLEEFAQQKVDSGDYSSISEVVREGMRMLKKKDQEEQAEAQKLKQLQSLIAVGVEQESPPWQPLAVQDSQQAAPALQAMKG